MRMSKRCAKASSSAHDAKTRRGPAALSVASAIRTKIPASDLGAGFFIHSRPEGGSTGPGRRERQQPTLIHLVDFGDGPVVTADEEGAVLEERARNGQRAGAQARRHGTGRTL